MGHAQQLIPMLQPHTSHSHAHGHISDPNQPVTAHSCGLESSQEWLKQQNPNYEQELQDFLRAIPQLEQAGASDQRAPIYRIPIIVHVVHQSGQAIGQGQNLSTARIQSNIDRLNLDFRKANSDAGQIRGTFASVAADVEIEFCLASIQRHVYNSISSQSYIENTIKPATTVTPSQYLNVWTLPIPGTSNFGGVLGYAYLPSPGIVGSNLDGIVVDYRWMGDGNGSNGNGRTLTHEVGHYLGLPHIWGNGCGSDDGVSDTPDQQAATGNTSPGFCPNSSRATCGSLDLWENYMDYVNDDCMVMYSQGQANVMRAVMAGTAGSIGYGSRAALAANGDATCNTTTTCDVPTNLGTSTINANDAVLTFNAVAGASSYNIRAREVGTSTWATGSVTGTSVSYTGLTACTNYEFQIEAVCGGTTSGYSGIATFTTAGCSTPCTVPSGLTASNLSANGATLAWAAVSGATNYNFRYRIVGSSTWTTASNATNSVTIGSLSNCTDYEFQVEADCGGSNTSGYSASTTFSTSGCACPIPSNLSTNSITNNSAQLDWTTVTGAVGYNVRAREAGTSVWTVGSVTSNTASYTGLDACTDYEFQIQTDCGGGSLSSYSSSQTFTTLGCSGTTCTAPATLGVTNVSGVDATLTWNLTPNALSYNVRIRATGTTGGTWITFSNQPGPSMALTGFASCTEYEFQVEADCGNNTVSGYSASYNFFSDGCTTPSCDLPTGVTATVIDDTIRYTWNPVTNAASYSVRLRTVGSSTWTPFSGYTSTDASFFGFIACTDYEFQVQAFCSSDSSGYTNSIVTTSPGCVVSCDPPTNLTTTPEQDTVYFLWDSVATATAYRVRVQETSATNAWFYSSLLLDPFAVVWGFVPCTEYEYQVQTYCGSDSSGYSASEIFLSPGCASSTCAIPSVLGHSVDVDTATFSWSAVTNATSYTIRLKQTGAFSWSVFPGYTSTSARIFGFSPCTDYDFEVQAFCGTGDSSGYSSTYIYTSNGCGGGSCVTVNNLNNGNYLNYASDNWGYVGGHNGYLDIAKAEYFNYTGVNTLLNGAYFEFARAHDATGSSQATFYVWDATGANNSPGSILSTVTVPIANISTSGATYIDFGALTLPANGEFYIGFGVDYSNGDTLAVYTNTAGQTTPATAWEQWSDNNWYAYDDVNSWGLGVAHAITPSICPDITCTKDVFEPNNDMASAAPFPAVGVNRNARICEFGDEDWYYFDMPTSHPNFQVFMRGLGTDFDMELYDAAGTRIGISQNPSLTDERIVSNFGTAGRYYVRIYGWNDAISTKAYNLKMNNRANLMNLMAYEPYVIPREWREGGNGISQFKGEKEENNTPWNIASFDLYPNPTNGEVSLTYGCHNMMKVELRVVDIYGKTVWNQTLSSQVGNNEVSLNLSHLSTGIYMVELNMGDYKRVKKLELIR